MVDIFTIGEGMPLYHGTRRAFDETAAALRPCSWIGYPWSESLPYIKGPPDAGATNRMVRFEASRELRFLSVPSIEAGIENLVAGAASRGLDGILIDFRQHGIQGCFFVFADPASSLRHLATYPVPWSPPDFDGPETPEPLELMAATADDPELPPDGVMEMGPATAPAMRR